jgi:hypothetical protein
MRSVLVSTGAALLAATVGGCTVMAEPAAAPPPPPPAPVYASEAPAPPPPAAPPVAEDDAVVYDDAPPPATDIEAYPSVVYGGATVYYVGGVWYRRGPRGWARYRAEPPDLARVRVAHARDARWARQGAPRPAPPGAAQMQRRPAPPAREVPR